MPKPFWLRFVTDTTTPGGGGDNTPTDPDPAPPADDPGPPKDDEPG